MDGQLGGWVGVAYFWRAGAVCVHIVPGLPILYYSAVLYCRLAYCNWEEVAGEYRYPCPIYATINVNHAVLIVHILVILPYSTVVCLNRIKKKTRVP